jgi:anti-sigma factor RsiW
MLCAESLRLQAYFDDEVDALCAPDIERHMEGCAECCALLHDLERTRAALRQDLRYARTPPRLRARVMRVLDEESAVNTAQPYRRSPKSWHTRPFWAGAAGGVGTAAIAATLAFFLMAPLFTNPLVDDLVGAHLRSLIPTHLIDVASTDKHTVKPWFAGHTDISPVVADFKEQGYRLIGARADYLEHQRSAVVVYQHGQHIINVFSWAANQRALPRNTIRNGYHLVFWRAGDLEYCVVSDTAADELLGLVRLLRDLSARDGRE